MLLSLFPLLILFFLPSLFINCCGEKSSKSKSEKKEKDKKRKDSKKGKNKKTPAKDGKKRAPKKRSQKPTPAITDTPPETPMTMGTTGTGETTTGTTGTTEPTGVTPPTILPVVQESNPQIKPTIVDIRPSLFEDNQKANKADETNVNETNVNEPSDDPCKDQDYSPETLKDIQYLFDLLEQA